MSVRARPGRLGLLIALACAAPALAAEPSLVGEPGVRLNGDSLVIHGTPVDVANVNACWESPSHRFVAYSRVYLERPSEPPPGAGFGGGGELMPFYAVGVIDVQSRAVVLDFEPPQGSSVIGLAWQDEQFGATVTLGATIELTFDPVGRRILAHTPAGDGELSLP